MSHTPMVNCNRPQRIDDNVSVASWQDFVDAAPDPRAAVHSHSIDPPEHAPGSWPGEAKVVGRAIEVDPSGEPAGQFCVELTDVVITYLDGQLVIERWTADKGITRYERG